MTIPPSPEEKKYRVSYTGPKMFRWSIAELDEFNQVVRYFDVEEVTILVPSFLPKPEEKPPADWTNGVLLVTGVLTVEDSTGVTWVREGFYSLSAKSATIRARVE